MKIEKHQFVYISKKLNLKLRWLKWNKDVNIIFRIGRQPEFMAQCMHESNMFRCKEENLNYTTPERIKKVFKAVKSIKQAKSLVRNPKKLAEVVYGNHPHLGNNKPGAIKLYKKGWSVYDFRGQGFIQLTGYNNWCDFNNSTNLNPFFGEPVYGEDYEPPTPRYFIDNPYRGACFFWIKRKIDFIPTFKEMTRVINGGYNGLKDREKKLLTIYKLMKEAPYEKTLADT